MGPMLPLCGWCCSPYRQPQAQGPEVLLRKSGNCFVAAYCAALYASAGWSVHRTSCGPCRAYVTSRHLRGDGARLTRLGAPPPPGDTPCLPAVLLSPVHQDLSRDSRRWEWPATEAALVLDAGFCLADMVALVEPGIG